MSVANILLFSLSLATVVAFAADDLAFANSLASDVYPKAKCLDGSQGRYYIRKGHGDGLNKFFLHQQGGGFCDSMEDCLGRSRTRLGSTLPHVPDPWGPTLNLSKDPNDHKCPKHYFSRDQKTNPLLFNWNHVFMVYCDGAYFSGDNMSDILVDGNRLHFSGKHILDATLHDLASQHGLRDATDVMLGGCSAGAIATFLHLDYVSNELQQGLAPRARLVGFPDSGFYLDEPYIDSQKVFPFVYQNLSGVLSQACLQQYSEEPYKCVFAENNAIFLQTPLFAWQSKFDGDQIWNSFKTPCAQNATCAMGFAKHLVQAMRQTLFRDGAPGHGAFIDGCWRHCQWTNNGGNISKIIVQTPLANLTPLTALHLWYSWFPGESLFIDQPASNFPCKNCCGPLQPDYGRILV